jgi:addiction module HigA family antidote
MSDIPTIGEVLREEFMEPFGLSQNALARALGIPQNRISEIVSGRRGVSADTDLRLCRYFGLPDGYFAGMQLDFERITTKRAISVSLLDIVPMRERENVPA